MDTYEHVISDLLKDIRQYNCVEFYHEENVIKSKIKEIKAALKAFNNYMPKYSLQIEDMSLAIN
jgi:hypothetical protein